MVTSAILVIDDDPALLDTVSMILQDEGYVVEQATNGAEGLAMIDRVRPALVVLDMRMPVMDGWGFVRALGDRRTTVPILVMTAAQDARRWAYEVGADGFLAKPFEIDDLIAAVARHARLS